MESSAASLPSSASKDPAGITRSKMLQEFKVTMAYEKALNKDKCNLCLMYFDRKTVCYKVPNHRLFHIHKKWNKARAARGDKDVADKEGRRYENASFLYQAATVCAFCAQFFAQLPEDAQPALNRDDGFGILPIKRADSDKITLSTAVNRQNVAVGQRAYQSSDVDHKTADLALSPPYDISSRTRREADPWWEMDFGRFCHIHSFSFSVLVGVRQRLEIYVMALAKPIGFEDPFLDHVQPLAKLTKIFTCDAKGKSRTENLSWELPVHSKCYALRIQLKGIHTLALSHVQALQGDDIVLSNEDDRDISAKSLASLAPQSIRSGLKDMMSPSRKPSTADLQALSPSFDPSASIDAVAKLSNKIQHQYEQVDKWKTKVLEMIQVFQENEILALYRVIFKYVSDINMANVGKHAMPLYEHELMSSGLIAHSPRADLSELHQRIRSVIRWIQTRSHMKVLGALLDSDKLNAIAFSPSDQLYHLMSAFKRVEYYWNKREHYEEMEAMSQELQDPGHTHLVHAKTKESRGCSWSQFLMIMCYFCRQQCELIPEAVFGIQKKYAKRRMSDMQDLDSKFSYQSGEGRSVSSYALSVMRPNAALRQGQRLPSPSDESVMAVPTRARTSHQMNRMYSQADLLSSGPSVASWSITSMPWLQPKADQLASRSLVDTVREDGHVPFDSAFSEYKFAHMKKKLSKDIQFPKDLSLEFARSLITHKGAPMAMHTPSDLMLGGNLEGGSLSPGDDQSRGSNTSSITGIGSFDLPSTPLPKLTRMSINMNNKSMRLSVMGEDEKLNSALAAVRSMRGGLSRQPTMAQLSATEFEAPQPRMLNRSMTMRDITTPKLKRMGSVLTVRTNASEKKSTVKDDLDDLEDLISENSSSSHKHISKEMNAIDFHRVCALCEVRFPRSAVEMKVVRKHIVKLRTSWDPTLVSKEVRSLDNTISMYNLVYVCVFCAQFFDPDFPDGIAYPTRITTRVSASPVCLPCLLLLMLSPGIHWQQIAGLADS